MTSGNLENLVKTNHLKAEAADRKEFDGLVRSGRARLTDARKSDLSCESRFDLAYNAAHALSLGLTLVTDNVQEFNRVNGLQLENWLEG